MPRFGLIGYPIAGSASPERFRRAYSGKWGYDLIEEESFEKAWKRFIDDYDAVNVTAPFKELACSKADILSQECKLTGAANILVKTPEGIVAHNSDYLAIEHILRELGSGTVLVVGYGGAGKTAAAAAASAGFDVKVCNRTVSKADGIHPLEDIPVLAAAADVLIYTLPCRIPQMNEVQSVPAIIEAGYREPFLASKTARYFSGDEWNLLQARFGYRFMTGVEPGL